MTQDELFTKMLNSFETLSRKVDTLQETVKKNTEVHQSANQNITELRGTVSKTNEIFTQVSQSISEIYSKIQQFELLAKLAKNLGPMLGGLGGLGGLGNPPKGK